MMSHDSSSDNLELNLEPDVVTRFKLQRGEHVIFRVDDSPESRIVRAEWITDLLERSGKTLKTPIRISRAVIHGHLTLRHCIFESDFVIADSVFREEVDLSSSSFQREFSLDRCHFSNASKFTNIETRWDFNISEAKFVGNTDCRSMNIGKAIQARGAHFSRVDFEGTVVQGDAIFISSSTGNPATFGSDATFISSKVHGQADFSSAQFMGESHFDLMCVDGGVFFRRDEFRELAATTPVTCASEQYPPVRFLSEATFIDAHFSGQADFTGVQFAKSASFDGMAVQGDALFGKDDLGGPARFGGEARFPGVAISGQANFIGAIFDDQVLFRQARVVEEILFGDASFHGASVFDHFRFEGPAFFRSRNDGAPAHFVAEASFRGATFLSAAHFDGIGFQSRISFDGARFEADGDFRRSTFASDAEFTGILAARDLCFQGAVFKGRVSFRETSCRALFLREALVQKIQSDTGPQFYGGLDLIGLSYERIYVAWEELLNMLDPFDAHPYKQLERSLRGSGDDASAGEVYVRQRLKALRLYWADYRKWWRAIRDSIYFIVARFGVRPIRLLVIAVALLCMSASIFSEPGAVIPKRDFGELPRQLVWLEGLGVAVNLFLPVEVPIGAVWRPSDEPIPIGWMSIGPMRVTFAFWATGLRLAGWIIVPLGLATVTGILRRQSKT